MRNFTDTVDDADLIQRPQIWRKAAMHTQHAAIDQCTKRQVIKNFSAVTPRICVAILALTFVVEPIHLRTRRPL